MLFLYTSHPLSQFYLVVHYLSLSPSSPPDASVQHGPSPSLPAETTRPQLRGLREEKTRPVPATQRRWQVPALPATPAEGRCGWTKEVLWEQLQEQRDERGRAVGAEEEKCGGEEGGFFFVVVIFVFADHSFVGVRGEYLHCLGLFLSRI